MNAPSEERLRHGRVGLRLLRLRDGPGLPLLLLHGLHESADRWGAGPQPWPGPVYALDFCGHGGSDWLRGGAYSEELLAADADTALAHIGHCALLGRGIGAYAALLLAGGRPEEIEAAVLTAGPGLDGGGPRPVYGRATYDLDYEWREKADVGRTGTAPSDPRLVCCDRTVRPPDYAADFADAAHRLIFVEDGSPRPPWWEAARSRDGGVRVGRVEDALGAVGSDPTRVDA